MTLAAAAGGGGGGYQVPGDPSVLFSVASQLRTLGEGLTNAAEEVNAIKSGQWKGPAADAFKNVISAQPAKFAAAGDAYTAAANTLVGYADALQAAQQVATNANTIADSARTATQSWQASGPSPGSPPPGPDPGTAGRQQAASLFSQAQGDLDQAANAAAAALTAAEHGAPQAPGFFSQVFGGVESFFSGVGEGVVGMAEGIWQLSKLLGPLDVLNPVQLGADLADPSRLQHSLHQLGQIGDGIAKDPVGFLKNFGENLINLKEWEKDPAKAAGELVPTVVLAVLSGGAGAAAKGVDVAADGADAAETADAAATAADPALDAAGATPAATVRYTNSIEQTLVASDENGSAAAVSFRAVVEAEGKVPVSQLGQAAETGGSLSDGATLSDQAATIVQDTLRPYNNLKTSLQSLDKLETGVGLANNVVASSQDAESSDATGSATVAGKAGEHLGDKLVDPITEFHGPASDGGSIDVFIPEP